MGLYVAKTTSATTAAPELGDELPLVASAIAAEATGPLIEVTTTQTFTNTSKHTIEAVYVFPLPPDAAVSAMAITTGDQTIHAEVVTRDQGLARHEAAVAAGVVGALFEQDRPDVFTQTITGIAPGATVAIELRWDTVAVRRAGAWELVVPLVVAPRAVPGTATGAGVVGSGTSPDTDRSPDASRVTPPTRADGTGTATTFSLVLDARASGVTSPSHELTVKSTGDGTRVTATDPTSARDLIVRWKTKGKPRGWLETDDAEGFVAITVEAGKPAGKAHPVRVVIAVDDGGPAGESTVIGHHVERAVIGALGKKDRFAARGASGAYAWERGGAAGAAKRDASPPAASHDLVAALGPLADAIAGGDGTPEVVLVTDGLVADQTAAIAAAVKLGVPVHVIGVGAAPNRSLVQAIAAATGGTARFVDPGADATAIEALAKTVLADVAHPAAAPVIDWGGLEVVDACPAVMPRLGAGQAITITARTKVARAARVKVDRSGAFAIEVDARPTPPAGATTPHGLIARLWARARLGELIDTGGAPADISKLALGYGLVSPYTAMVAVGEQVVEQGGTGFSMAVPVAVPNGMRWQERYHATELDGRLTTHKPPDENRVDQDGAGAGADGSDDLARGGQAKTPSPDKEHQREVETTKGDEDFGRNADLENDENPIAPTGSTIAPNEPVFRDGGGEALSIEGSPVRHRTGLVLGLRATGGLVITDATRTGMGAISGRLAAALGPVEGGVDASLWIVGSDTDVVGRILLTTSFTGLFSGWLDLSLGAGAHLADDSGVGYAAGLRFGRGKYTPTLRWDGAVVRGADGHLHSLGAANLGLEISF